MQSTPSEEGETSTGKPTFQAAVTGRAKKSPAIPQLTPADSQASIATTPTGREFTFVQAIYIPEVEDEFPPPDEDITPLEQQQQVVMPLFSCPSLDPLTRDISRLQCLQYFIPFSPGLAWNFYELFPHITDYIVQVSMDSDSLRHTLLALDAMVRDAGTMSETYFIEKATSLRCLQEAISSDAVDGAMAIAVIMHIGMDVLLGTTRYMRNHLRGVHLILERLKEKGRVTGKGLSPLALLTQRMTIRIDAVCNSLLDDGIEFESIDPTVELEDRKWLTTNIGASQDLSSSNIEWALASFELDNLQYRGYIAAKRADTWRQENDPQKDEKIVVEYRKLMQGLDLWKQRAIIQEQEEIEQYARQVNTPSDDPQFRFLNHEPLYIQNIYYGKLLNQWRMLCIYNSLIISPDPGPEPASHDRYNLAVDICRTHAALGMNAYIGPSWQTLFYAGMVFAGRKGYPEESEWILERLEVVAAGLPTWRPVIESMPLMWESEMSHWNGFAGLFGVLDS